MLYYFSVFPFHEIQCSLSLVRANVNTKWAYPFQLQIYENQRPLKIGYYVYDGCTRCVPAVERAVMLAKAALETLGHTVKMSQHLHILSY